MYHFLDTSAILNGALKDFQENIYISTFVLTELENIKTSFNKDEQVKYLARQAMQDIINSKNVTYILPNQQQINKVLKKYSFLSDIIDHRILCEAYLLTKKQKEQVQFITSDSALFIIAKHIPNINTIYFKPRQDIEYNGWNNFFPNDDELTLLYSNPKTNILKCLTNEFVKIYVKDELKDLLFWDGQEYRKIRYKEYVSPTGERIKPRNIEQKMYLDLLQNDNIPIKLCIGRFGTGKSMFAETWALNQLEQGKFNKIIFIKNNLEVKGSGKLGILPGNEIDKQYPWLRQIEDHLGTQLFEEYLNDGRIEPAHLSTLRGRDLKNCLILVDEAENLLTTNIQLLLGRVGEGSQIIFCADIKQCDYKDISMSGIPKLISNLKGNPLFGMVKLIKTERSAVAATADLLD